MLAVYFIACAVIIGVDQWVKAAIVANISLGDSTEVIPHFFSLTYLQNTGAAWSMFEGKMSFFTVITVVAVAIILYMIIKYRKNHFLFLTGLTLILAGAIGNFIDRIRLGYVVDMMQLDFINFPIFNVADMALTVGVVILFIYTLFEERLKGTNNGK